MLDQKDLIKKIKNYNKFLNPETLNKAYNFALNAHKNQKRDSGDPYLSHPVAVANILTDLKLDSATIATGLLHDTIEDTKITYDIVQKEFGSEVADLVDGVTKISELEGKVIENSKAENIRKLILTGKKKKFSANTDTLLYLASRSDHVEKTILPSLKKKKNYNL